MATRTAQRELFIAARDEAGPPAYSRAVANGASINYHYFYRYGRNAYFTFTTDARDARGNPFEHRLWVVSPDLKPTDGDTLLHIAIRLQRGDLLLWLKDRGVDPDRLPNKMNQLPSVTAEELGGPHLSLYNRVFGLSAVREQQTKAIYDRALAQGQAPLYRSKLLVFGQGGAGKTSLLRALCKETFDAEEPTTEVMDITPIEISPAFEWRKTSSISSLFKEQIAHFVCEGLQRGGDSSASDTGSTEAAVTQEATSTGPHEPSPPPADSSSVAPAVEGQAPADEAAESMADDLILNDREAIQQIHEEMLALEAAERGRKVTLSAWDFGGQELYYALHHVFIRTTGIFLVVFNLHDALTDPDKTSRHLLHWVNSIHTYSKRQSWTVQPPGADFEDPLSSPHEEDEVILLVGTHKDQLPQAQIESALAEIDDMLFRTFRGLDCYCRLQFPPEKTGSRIYFAVSNKTSGHDDGEMKALRDAIGTTVGSRSFVHRPRPLRWIRTNDAFRLWRRKEEDAVGSKVPPLGLPGEIITRREVRHVAQVVAKRIARATGVEQTVDDEELGSMLHFLHDIGELLYFDDLVPAHEQDDNIVLLEYTWLVRVLGKILIRDDPRRDKKMPREFQRQRPHKTQAMWAQMWEDLSVQGVLHQDLLLFRLWAGVPEATSAVTLRLLEKLDLMCALHPEGPGRELAGGEVRYLIPSIPMYYATDRRGDAQQGKAELPNLGAPFAIFHFGGFLPEGLFPRLLVLGVRRGVFAILSIHLRRAAVVITLPRTGAEVSIQLCADPQGACINFHRAQQATDRPSRVEEAAEAAFVVHDVVLATCQPWYGKAAACLKVYSKEDPDHLFDVHRDILGSPGAADAQGLSYVPRKPRARLISKGGAEVKADQFQPWVNAHALLTGSIGYRVLTEPDSPLGPAIASIALSDGSSRPGSEARDGSRYSSEDEDDDDDDEEEEREKSRPSPSVMPVPTVEQYQPSPGFQGVKYTLASAVAQEAFDSVGLVQVHFTKRLGAGSFGQVYACSIADCSLEKLPPSLRQKLRPFCKGKRRACVKLLHGLSDPDWRQLSLRDFERELVSHSTFEHPRIIQYLGQVPRQLHPYLGETCGIVMEQADSTLKEHWHQLREARDMTAAARWRHVVQLGQDIAEGLHALHENALKIVHRDVHEENVLVVQGRALIGDFGRGKALQRCGTGAFHTREPGLLLIVPPEAAGPTDSYDCSYDIFGLGFILAKLALFASLGEEEWKQHLGRLGKGPLGEEFFWKQSRARQDELVREWQAWLMQSAERECHQANCHNYWQLIVRCCERDPRDRPQAAQVAAALSSLLMTTGVEELI